MAYAFCLYPEIAKAQSSNQIGLLPSINLNHGLKEDWSVNFKIESRQLLQRGIFDDDSMKDYEYILTDYSLIAAKKLGLNSRLSGGYLFRQEEDGVVSRFIQQYTTVQRFNGFRLAHRIVTDQTFSKDENTEYRLRYRVSSEIPLNGKSADTQEFYIKINNEYLNSIQERLYDLELRIVPLIGYSFLNTQKIELGVDYRVNSFVSGSARHRVWYCFNWYFNL